MDYFALLGQPRQPWLEPDALKAAFLEQSARLHPDRIASKNTEERADATRRFAELNAAYRCLREPKDRLFHLLEMESAATAANVQNVPPEMVDVLMETGQVCRQTDQFLAAKAKVSSPLLQAQMFEQGLEWTDKLQVLQGRIQLRRDELLAELRAMNDAWKSAPPLDSPTRAASLPLKRLEEAARTLSYLARSSGQIQERLAQLSF